MKDHINEFLIKFSPKVLFYPISSSATVDSHVINRNLERIRKFYSRETDGKKRVVLGISTTIRYHLPRPNL